MMEERWKKFERGDTLSDDEISVMLREIQAALPYLRSRGEPMRLVVKETVSNLMMLEQWQAARKRKSFP